MLKPTIAAIFAFLFISICNAQSGGSIPILYDRKIISAPKVAAPPEAVETGLGGAVSVQVTVDAAGKVVDVGESTGPGPVCRQVTRADVLALRAAAANAARLVKFAPLEDASAGHSRSWVRFVFASGKEREPTGADYKGPVSTENNNKDRFPITGDRDYAAATVPPANGGEGKILSGGALNGKAESLPRPPYPPAARAVKAAGAVNVEVVIDEDGSIFSSQAISGHPLLRAAAVNAACQARFTPTTLEGKPVRVAGVIVYSFVP